MNKTVFVALETNYTMLVAVTNTLSLAYQRCAEWAGTTLEQWEEYPDYGPANAWLNGATVPDVNHPSLRLRKTYNFLVVKMTIEKDTE